MSLLNRIAIREVEQARATSSLTVCAHCHERTDTTRLYRLMGVGLRPLCGPCAASLDRLGMSIRAA